MGRTKRRRKRKLFQFSLDDDLKIIKLKKWLTTLGWKNVTKLKLTYFKNTGRGLSSTIKISPNDKLISIPYESIITYISFQDMELYHLLKNFPKTLTTEECFTIFLSLEKHKDKKSKWKIYLDTLPEVPLLPWKLNKEEFNLIPEEISKKIIKSYSIIDNFNKINLILKTTTCKCCKKYLNEIITQENFYNNYVLFMTRCVYINYNDLKHLTKNNTHELIKDEPNMVLCPLLDMFNHSSEADAELEFKKEGVSYFLNVITRSSFLKNSQLFFSYGKHDNLSLFCYYGFYLEENDLDFIEFTKDDLEDLFKNVLKSKINQNINQEKLKFMKEKKLDENLIWHKNEPSFNLLSIAYIISTNDLNWKNKIYCEDFNTDDLGILKLLLEKKISHLDECIIKMEMISKKSNSLLSIIEFCKHRLKFLKCIKI